MIYITTAMYIEAAPFIKKLGLKKKEGYGKYQVFKNEELILVITGTGIINAAAGISFVFGKELISKNDIIMNIGICGAKKDKFHIGDCIMCSKIIDKCTSKTYYPDILYKHPFKESSILTVYQSIYDEQIDSECVDMESSGFYTAVSAFVYQHNIHIIKIVSDYMNGKIEKDFIKNTIEEKSDIIINWIKERIENVDESIKILNHEEILTIKEISKVLKLTETMRHEFIKLCENYKVRNNDIISILNSYKNVEICTQKREGKRLFNEIRQQLIKF